MPANSEAEKKLRELYAKARNGGIVLNYALAHGQKEDQMLFLADRKKPPQKLLLDVKDEGETNKFAFGTMKVLKDELQLTCIKKPATGTAKRVRKYLKAIKISGAPSIVVIVDGEGNSLESDGEAAAPEAAEQQTDAPAVDPDREKWETSFAKIGPAALQRIKAGGEGADKLAELLKMGRAKAAEENFAAALKVLPAIVQLLKAPPAAQATEPEPESDPPPATEPRAEDEDKESEEQFQARRQEVVRLLADALKQKNPHATAAQSVVKQALGQAKARNFAEGLARLDEAVRILSQPVLEPAADPAQEDEEDVRPEAEAVVEKDEATLELQARLVAVARAVRESGLPDNEVDRLSRALVKAGAYLKKGDGDTCESLLDMVDRALSAPPPEQRLSGREIANQLRDIWDDANKSVSQKLDQLRKAFGEIDDPNCKTLADGGLTSFTGGLYVRLNKSFLELQEAKPDQVDTACAVAAGTLGAFRKMIETHEAVQLIDRNHFGLTVGMGKTLGEAIAQMQDICRNPAPAEK